MSSSKQLNGVLLFVANKQKLVIMEKGFIWRHGVNSKSRIEIQLSDEIKCSYILCVSLVLNMQFDLYHLLTPMQQKH